MPVLHVAFLSRENKTSASTAIPYEISMIIYRDVVCLFRLRGKLISEWCSVAKLRKNSVPDPKATRSHRRVPHCYIIGLIFSFVSLSLSRASLLHAGLIVSRAAEKRLLYRRLQCTNLEIGRSIVSLLFECAG